MRVNGSNDHACVGEFQRKTLVMCTLKKILREKFTLVPVSCNLLHGKITSMLQPGQLAADTAAVNLLFGFRNSEETFPLPPASPAVCPWQSQEQKQNLLFRNRMLGDTEQFYLWQRYTLVLCISGTVHA